MNDVPSRCVDDGEAKGSFLPGHNNGTCFHRDGIVYLWYDEWYLEGGASGVKTRVVKDH